jgi:hypothetical protein
MTPLSAHHLRVPVVALIIVNTLYPRWLCDREYF